MGSAFKLGTELVAAVAVGTIFGFILDSWFGTKPCLLYTSDAADDTPCVDLGGRRII